MSLDLFPRRIETDRLTFERVSRGNVDPFEFHEFVTREDWQGAATEHMPWFGSERLDQVADFVEAAESQWADGDTARYVLRSTEEDGDLVGITAYGPEWEERRGGSGIVVSVSACVRVGIVPSGLRTKT